MNTGEHSHYGDRMPPTVLLRAPPFPGARPRGGPRSRLAGDAEPARHRERIPPALLAEALARTRTGGSFWVEQPHDKPILGDGDLWPRIAHAQKIVAPAKSELALLAAAANKDVVDPLTAQPIPRAALLNALAERVDAFDYFDPFDGAPIDAHRWIEILGEWRRTIDANRQIGGTYGISLWKRRAISRFLWRGSGTPGKAIAIWPSRTPASVTARAASAGVPVLRIEDGFIRSAGLGTLLHPPQSIVVDRLGIYYDPHRPSDLERLLTEIDLDDRLRARAAKLIRALTDHSITKYGAGGSPQDALPQASRRVLVAGQVEDDQSVLLGGGDVRGNLDLLRRARAAEPGGYIVYRPHPDVVAGLRKGQVAPSDALHHADAVLANGAIPALLRQVDAVHVLTSLAGFEALLRGKEVVTHGQPFYAGWGLTTDLAAPIARRQRRLSLEELVAAALILYPRYLDPDTQLPCPPEILVRRLADRHRPRAGILQALRMLQGRLAIARRTLASAAS